MEKNINIGLYVLTGISLIILAAGKFLGTDDSIIAPIVWALLGAILGRNTDNAITFGKKAMGSFKK